MNFQYNEGANEAGKIKRCPSCGEGIPSFVVICPACGNELSNISFSKSLRDFIEEVSYIEGNIFQDNSFSASGWSSWGAGKKIGFVFLNIFFFMIPLLLHTIVSLIRINSKPNLNFGEKRLASLIENYQVNNDRQSILETLIFIKEKIDFLSNESMNRKSAFWFRIWYAKAQQLKQKADLMIRNDKVLEETYKEILSDKRRVDKKIRRKAFLGASLSVLLFLVLLFWQFKGQVMETYRFYIAKPLELPENKLTRLIPKLEDKKGQIDFNHSGYFALTYYKIEDIEFEDYVYACEQSGFTVDSIREGSSFRGFNPEGYQIFAYYYDKELKISISEKVKMAELIWPTSELTALIPVPKSSYGELVYSSEDGFSIKLGKTTINDFYDYVKLCNEGGFKQRIFQSERYFSAENKDGVKLALEYIGFNIMEIQLTKPEVPNKKDT